jgi:hypothetical protein
MKKYLFGLFAIILAVSFSAFSTAKKHSKTSGTPYYWYTVDASGNVADDNGPLNGSTEDKDAAVSNMLGGCPNSTGDFCILGSTSNSLTNSAHDQISAGADNVIRKNP